MKERYVIISILSLALTVFAGLFIFTLGSDIPKNQSMPWESHVNEHQQTVVFDLVMGSDRVIDAARIFGVEIQASLFEDVDGGKQLEAYFSNTKVGGISAGIILNLAIKDESMVELNTHIDEIMMMPSGVKKTTFLPIGDRVISSLVINSLSFVPKADLDEQVIKKLFGQPDRIEVESAIDNGGDNGGSYWYYPNKGLRIIIGTEQKEIFEFSNH